MELFAIARDDAGSFLAAMLKGIEAQICQIGRFFVSVNSEDGALVVKLVGSEHRERVRGAAGGHTRDLPVLTH